MTVADRRRKTVRLNDVVLETVFGARWRIRTSDPRRVKAMLYR